MNEQKFHVGVKALIEMKAKFLLLRVNPKELKNNKHGIYWDLPGGRIKEGDSAEETLVKEINEELNLDEKDVEIIKPFHGSISNIKIPADDYEYGLVLLVYLCRLKNNKKLGLSFEHTDYKWADMNEAKKLLSVKFSKSFIDELDKIKSVK